MLNHGDYNKSILAEAHGICNNLTENSRLSTENFTTTSEDAVIR
jgi:hypothetical protein